ncbi:hypothetical protein RRG08_065746 [Elysia crispata]|uniref:TCTP domain-containing protein n=1 Tax=Elysia crispata TaxID=231223 RepID=A0AAE1DBX1_9GAST|nr:hypothetical protein RRG08_065746 [Elysia crispata]
MIVYKCLITGDELFTDAYKTELIDGFYIVKGAVSQVCQHTSANAAPWNRYPLGRNFRQEFVAISAHGQQALHRHQSAFLPAHVSVAQRGDNQMV